MHKAIKVLLRRRAAGLLGGELLDCWEESCWIVGGRAVGLLGRELLDYWEESCRIIRRRAAGLLGGELLDYWEESCWIIGRRAAGLLGGELLYYWEESCWIIGGRIAVIYTSIYLTTPATHNAKLYHPQDGVVKRPTKMFCKSHTPHEVKPQYNKSMVWLAQSYPAAKISFLMLLCWY